MTRTRSSTSDPGAALARASAFRVYAREASAKAIAALSFATAIAIVLVWPTDLLIDTGAPGLLRQFALYRVSVGACALLIGVAVLRSSWLRARPAAALLGGCLLIEALMLVHLAPRVTLDHGWMDLQYLWPLATVTLFVPLAQRVFYTVALTGALLALTLSFTPGELARPFLWVNAVVFALSIGVSLFIGARVNELIARMHANTRLLEEHNLQLAARINQTRADLRRTYSRIVDERERERVHLSRELHDATGQLLTALRLNVGVLRRDGGDARLLDELDATLDELFARIQRILLDLRPALVDDLGLSEALELLARSTSKHRGVAVDGVIEALAPGLLDVPTSVSIYRIAQRALELLTRLDVPLTLELRARSRAVALRVAADASLDALADDVAQLELEIEERARTLGARLRITPGPAAAISLELAVEEAE